MGRGLWLRNLGSSLAISQTLGTLAHSPTLGAVGLRGCLHPFGETGCRKGGGTVSDFDTDYTNYPICPHCGKSQPDPWEHELGEDESTEDYCWNCDKKMKITCHVSVTYSTKKIEEEK